MYLSEAKASHSHKMWTGVSSSVPHFPHLGSFPIPIIHRCLLKVLCPISRPITTLVWVLLRDNSQAHVAGSRPKIISRACLCILQVPRHNARSPPIVLVDFVVFPLRHGRSVTDFWGWNAHEAWLRCPNDVIGDIGRCSARRALKPKSY